MASLLMRFGAGAHAAEALRLVACGKAPSWRNEEVVQVRLRRRREVQLNIVR
jgi:hypothetical protein